MSTVIDGGTTTELTPGRQIRPVMDCDKAVQLVKSLYGFTVLDVHQMDSYSDRNFHVRVSAENHRNPHVQHVSSHGYVLKVMNSIDSLKPHVGENFFYITGITAASKLFTALTLKFGRQEEYLTTARGAFTMEAAGTVAPIPLT